MVPLNATGRAAARSRKFRLTGQLRGGKNTRYRGLNLTGAGLNLNLISVLCACLPFLRFSSFGNFSLYNVEIKYKYLFNNNAGD